jgi:hypothetical protein
VVGFGNAIPLVVAQPRHFQGRTRISSTDPARRGSPYPNIKI